MHSVLILGDVRTHMLKSRPDADHLIAESGLVYGGAILMAEAVTQAINAIASPYAADRLNLRRQGQAEHNAVAERERRRWLLRKSRRNRAQSTKPVAQILLSACRGGRPVGIEPMKAWFVGS